MEKRVIHITLLIAGTVALCYGAFLFLSTTSPTLKNTIFFVPAGVVFSAAAIIELNFNVLKLTTMDPITLVGFLVFIGIIVSSYFIEEVRAAKYLHFAVTIFTFITGFEAGKLRKRKQSADS